MQHKLCNISVYIKFFSDSTGKQNFYKNRILARNSFFYNQNYSEVDGLFCEINEGVCFTKARKLNPEECRTECKTQQMTVPSFYNLERVRKIVVNSCDNSSS